MPLTRIALLSAFLLPPLGLQAQIKISSPVNGGTLESPVQLSATLSGAQPSSLLVYDNGSLVLQKSGVSSIGTSLNLANGLHAITVKALEPGGLSSSATTSITVYTPVLFTTGTTPNLAAALASDMMGKNEGTPHGVPFSYAWATGPAVEMGNNSNSWKAATAWGVVYEAAQTNPAVNTRVNIRDVQFYLFQKSTKKWLLLQNTNTPAGAAYLESFAGNLNKPGDVRNEPDGTISVRAGGGYNYHFYPAARASINPLDIGGIVTIFQARLIVGNPALPDDRNIAAFLAGAGGDYYPALTGSWPTILSYNPGIAVGKEKYVETYWRFYSMTTMSLVQLQSNPPPIDLTGIEP